jgi:hypothetical protein
LDFTAKGGKRQGREVPPSLRVWQTQSQQENFPFLCSFSASSQNSAGASLINEPFFFNLERVLERVVEKAVGTFKADGYAPLPFASSAPAVFVCRLLDAVPTS